MTLRCSHLFDSFLLLSALLVAAAAATVIETKINDRIVESPDPQPDVALMHEASAECDSMSNTRTDDSFELVDLEWSAKERLSDKNKAAFVRGSVASEWAASGSLTEGFFRFTLSEFGIRVKVSALNWGTDAHTYFYNGGRPLESLPPLRPDGTSAWGRPPKLQDIDVLDVFAVKADIAKILKPGRSGPKNLYANWNILNDNWSKKVNDTFLFESIPGWRKLELPGLREVKVWISRTGSSCSAHYDTSDNLIAQIAGKKEWQLWDTNHELPRLFPSLSPHARQCQESPLFSQQWSDSLDVRPAHSVTMEPGDVMFVPSHWGHRVRCVEGPCVSINFWSNPDSSVNWPDDRDIVDALQREAQLGTDTPLEIRNAMWGLLSLESSRAAHSSEDAECFLRHLHSERYFPLYHDTFDVQVSKKCPRQPAQLNLRVALDEWKRSVSEFAAKHPKTLTKIYLANQIEIFAQRACEKQRTSCIIQTIACWASWASDQHQCS